MTAADTAANLAVCAKQRGGRNGGSGYPQLRLLALVSCGTRTVIDAVFRPCSDGETTCAPELFASLRAGMLLLADRGFAAGHLARQIADRKADFLIRVRTGNMAPKFPVLRRLPDGSWLSRYGPVLRAGRRERAAERRGRRDQRPARRPARRRRHPAPRPDPGLRPAQ